MDEQKGPRKSRLLLLVVALVGSVLVWRLTSPAPPRLPDRAEAVASPSPPVVADRAATPPPEPASSQPQAFHFSDGFCAPNGEDSSVTIRYTLPGLIREESDRRLAALPPDQQARTFRAVDDFLGSRTAQPDAATVEVLLLAAQDRSQAARTLELADQLAATAPTDPYVQVVRAVSAERLGRQEIRLDALRRARQTLPSDPAIGWSLAQALRDGPDLDEALAGLDAYLAKDPVPALERLRARIRVQRDIQREYRRLSRHGVTLLWPAGLLSEQQVDGVLTAVDDALDGAARLTGTPRRAALTAVVYPGKAELLAVSCVQRWTAALYDGTLRLVAAPGSSTGVPLTDLRHEALHAQLSPAAPMAPKWFHEGVAQSFAGEQARAQSTWRLMVRNRSWIPFASLAGSFQVFEDAGDANLAYAQSLGLVELIRASGGDEAVAEAVRAFREGADTETALARATHRSQVTGADLLDYLASAAHVPTTK